MDVTILGPANYSRAGYPHAATLIPKANRQSEYRGDIPSVEFNTYILQTIRLKEFVPLTRSLGIEAGSALYTDVLCSLDASTQVRGESAAIARRPGARFPVAV